MHGVARLIAHLFRAWGALARFFPAAVLDEITAAIAAGEERHLGEICFAVESRFAPLDALLGPGTRQRAEHLFGQLRVWDTAHNSGVLVYVLLCEHRIEIVADRGIAARVATKEWSALCDVIGRAFAAGDPAAGVKDAIAKIHDLLAQHFPAQGDNPRELSDVPYVL